MPDKSFESLSPEDLTRARQYKPGYDWIPGRFGPPPGIPRARKEQLDRMNDRDFMNAVLKMGQEEKESLMISEAERRRTFGYLWPNPDHISYKALARDGFYYTGLSDRVQCAFCAGTLGNWERGDEPSRSHKNFFSYCKMAQKKPCGNIPISEGNELPDEISFDQLSTRLDAHAPTTSLSDLGIDNSKPTHSRYRILSNRLGTYKHYSSSNPMKPEDLSEAGFFYEGPGDKVRCFWCDGALELWADGDEPWIEHAKWYPGCAFTQQAKGMNFIREHRNKLTSEELAIADDLEYNSCGFNPQGDDQEKKEDPELDYTLYDSYKTCVQLNFSEELLSQAFEHNQYRDFKDVQSLIGALLALEEDNGAKLEAIIAEQVERENTHEAMEQEVQTDDSKFNAEEFIRLNSEPSADDAAKMVDAMTCPQCGKNPLGAVLLPCGHFAICQDCTRRDLPEKCFVCNTHVRGACRAYIN